MHTLKLLKLIIYFLVAGELSLFPMQSSAQFIAPAKVPVHIKESFNIQFPGVKLPVWKLVYFGVREIPRYEITFTNENNRWWAQVDTSGKLLEVEKRLYMEDIPSRIVEYMDSNYRYSELTEARKIFLANGNLYFLLLSKGAVKYSLLLREDGSLLVSKSNLAWYITSFALACFVGSIDMDLRPLVSSAPDFFKNSPSLRDEINEQK
ncbi:MAG: hypothetical protein ABI763_07050 [Bacteroidota bacterium]